MCLAQGHRAVLLVGLKPATLGSGVQHSITATALPSHRFGFITLILKYVIALLGVKHDFPYALKFAVHFYTLSVFVMVRRLHIHNVRKLCINSM